jgi:hypothetical protein
MDAANNIKSLMPKRMEVNYEVQHNEIVLYAGAMVQRILILPGGEFVNNSLSVVRYRHFYYIHIFRKPY